MVCGQCKTVNPEDAVVCIKCTNPLGAAAAERADTTKDSESPSDKPSAASVEALVPGAVLGGRYELLKLIGEGGMGSVFKARDRELDRDVALKIIRPQLANDPKLVGRFKQELILARQVSHRNVVRIFDLGIADGIRFITMEYVEGRELADLLHHVGKLNPTAAVDIVKQVCMGLDAAHQEGITHRDLKPQNIMVDTHGRARIMDFGIARAMDSSVLTRTGALMGTPAYMSPEQAQGEKADARSDLYSLGIIFYELLTGRIPFEAETFMSMLLKRCQEPPTPPCELDPGIPPQINAIVLTALATNPAERYQSAAAMLRDLEMWNADPSATLPIGLMAPTATSPGSAAWVRQTGAASRMSAHGLPSQTSPASAAAQAPYTGGLSSSGIPQTGAPLPTAQASRAGDLSPSALPSPAGGLETIPVQPVPAAPRAGRPAGLARRRTWLAAFCLALLLASAAAFAFWKLRPAPRPSPLTSVSVLVADFDNITSEAVFDGTLEPVFITGLEDMKFVTTFSRGAAHRIAREIRPGATKVNEALARLIATREGINVILTGLVARQGDEYRVTVNAIDGATGKSIITKDSPPATKEDVLKAASRMIPALREALGDVAPESQKAASGETFTGGSLEAVHDYGAAQDLQWAGRLDDAAALYGKAVQEDPTMGRAYAGLAAVSANLGRNADAENYYRQALTMIDRMSDREKYRTRGGYYLAIRDQQKAVEEFSALVQQFPADTAARANLALAYLYARDMRRAMEEGREALKLYPNNALQRNNLALYAVYAGDSKTAAEEAAKVLKINPKYEKPYVTLAFAALLDGDPAKAAQIYESLRAVSPRGAALSVIGLADAAQYRGQYAASLKLLEEPGALDQGSPQSLAGANRLILAAEARLARGDSAQASRLAREAVQQDDSESISVLAARVFTRAKREGEARQIAARLDDNIAAASKAYAELIGADVLLQRGWYAAAMPALQQSKGLLDTWLVHFDLVRAYIAAGAFAQASSELDVCQRRRGEALSLFLDEMPTSRYLSLLTYYAGRAQEGLKSPAAAASFRAFLSTRQNGDDPLAADARRRLTRLEKK